jgi:hypothetical protein
MLKRFPNTCPLTFALDIERGDGEIMEWRWDRPLDLMKCFGASGEFGGITLQFLEPEVQDRWLEAMNEDADEDAT